MDGGCHDFSTTMPAFCFYSRVNVTLATSGTSAKQFRITETLDKGSAGAPAGGFGELSQLFKWLYLSHKKQMMLTKNSNNKKIQQLVGDSMLLLIEISWHAGEFQLDSSLFTTQKRPTGQCH